MRIRYAAIAAAMLLSSAALAQEKPAIILAMPGEPDTFDLCTTDGQSRSRILLGNIGEGLTARNVENGTLDPLLATEWSAKSPTEWEFKIREGVTFHDGAPLNAAAVVQSLQRHLDEEILCTWTANLPGGLGVSVEAVDDMTVLIKTATPDPIMPLRLASISIDSPNTSATALVETPLGTGPFKAAEWSRGQQIVLVENENYWGEKPAISKATYIFRTDEMVRSQVVGTGEADLAIGLSTESAGVPGAVTFTGIDVVMMRTNAWSPPFDDIRVRRAANMAVDRAGLIGAVWGGFGEPIGQILTESTVGHIPDYPVPPYDVDAAKALIEEAKADGVPVTNPSKIYVRADYVENGVLMSQALAAQLNAIGLNVGVEVQDIAAWADVLRSHDTDIPGYVLHAHNNNLGDASVTTAPVYDPAVPRSNIPEADRPKATELLAAAAAASGDERAKLYQEFFRWVNDDLAQDVFLAVPVKTMIVGPKVTYTPNALSDEIILLSSIKPAS
jgi:peptide/nickel transport system substrate-binding protein